MYLALAILMLVAIACGSPDVPRLSDGEASAMVRERIRFELDSGIRCDSSRVVDVSEHYRGSYVWEVSAKYRFGYYDFLSAWDYRGSKASVTRFPINLLDAISEIKAQDEWRKGKWSSEAFELEWLVYGTSLTIAPANTTTKITHLYC
jgi:hypothetical protein